MTAVPRRILSGISNRLPKKWVDYWRGVAHDYSDTAVNTLKQMKERPGKAAVYIGIAAFGCELVRTAPSSTSLHHTLVEGLTSASLLSSSTRSPSASQALLHRAQCWDLGTLRVTDLVLFSLAWEDNFNRELSSFRGTVKHLKPKYTTFFQTRVLDVGFLGRWWYLEHLLANIDINETEWEQ